jgi:hypothetical protein
MQREAIQLRFKGWAVRTLGARLTSCTEQHMVEWGGSSANHGSSASATKTLVIWPVRKEIVARGLGSQALPALVRTCSTAVLAYFLLLLRYTPRANHHPNRYSS